jgi:hypothetical protein
LEGNSILLKFDLPHDEAIFVGLLTC